MCHASNGADCSHGCIGYCVRSCIACVLHAFNYNLLQDQAIAVSLLFHCLVCSQWAFCHSVTAAPVVNTAVNGHHFEVGQVQHATGDRCCRLLLAPNMLGSKVGTSGVAVVQRPLLAWASSCCLRVVESKTMRVAVVGVGTIGAAMTL
jgi:hypothetical protein